MSCNRKRAHRGASGHLPGHTLLAYEEGIRSGADWIELDTMATKCGEMVVTHDIELSTSTDVAEMFPEVKSKIYAPCYDDEPFEVEGWLVSKMTLEEIKRLTVKHQSSTRSHSHLGSTSHHGVTGIDVVDNYRIPTVEETLTFLQGRRQAIHSSGLGDIPVELLSRPLIHSSVHLVPFRPEHSADLEAAYVAGDKFVELWIGKKRQAQYLVDLSDPAYYVQRNANSGYERMVVRLTDGTWAWQSDENPNFGAYIEMKRPEYHRTIGLPLEERLVSAVEKSGFEGPIIIQCFEAESLKIIASMKPQWTLVKLLTEPEVPLDKEPDEQKRLLDQIMQYANGIGPYKNSIVPNPMRPPLRSHLIDAAHKRNLLVHPYTFKTDHQSLHPVYGGNASIEFCRFFKLGVDGVFADFPDHAMFARSLYESLERHTDLDFVQTLFHGRAARTK